MKHAHAIANILEMELKSSTAAQRFVRGGRMNIHAIVVRVLELQEMLEAPEEEEEKNGGTENVNNA